MDFKKKKEKKKENSWLIQKQSLAYSVVRHYFNFKWNWLLWSDETYKNIDLRQKTHQVSLDL